MHAGLKLILDLTSLIFTRNNSGDASWTEILYSEGVHVTRASHHPMVSPYITARLMSAAPIAQQKTLLRTTCLPSPLSLP